MPLDMIRASFWESVFFPKISQRIFVDKLISGFYTSYRGFAGLNFETGHCQKLVRISTVAIAFAIRRAKIFAIAVPIMPRRVPNSQQRKRHNKPQPRSQLSPQPKSQKILVRLRSKMNHGFLINYLKVSKISLMKNLENQLNIKILLIGWKIQDFIFWMQNTIAGSTRNVRFKNSLK